VWQEAVLGHVGVALAPAHQASLEPEHPARARHGGRFTEAHLRLHRLPEVRQGRQGGADVGSRVRLRTADAGGHQGHDPVSRDGIVTCDTDLADYDLASDALDGSVLRMVRQGQRVLFELNGDGRATRLRLGSEIDMQTPGP
jgi:CspA family cold shock protein